MRSSQLYQTFDKILLLSHGHALYCGPGSFAPSEYFSAQGIAYREGYNVADHLLEIASNPPDQIVQQSRGITNNENVSGSSVPTNEEEKVGQNNASGDVEIGSARQVVGGPKGWRAAFKGQQYAATFLTQIEVLSGREWKNLRR